MTGSTKLKKKTSQKSLFKILCFNNKGTMKIKDFKNLSNKDTYFTCQYNNIIFLIYSIVKLYRRKPKSQP